MLAVNEEAQNTFIQMVSTHWGSEHLLKWSTLVNTHLVGTL